MSEQTLANILMILAVLSVIYVFKKKPVRPKR